MERLLEEAYTDPRHPGSYGGVDKLKRSLKGDGADGVTLKSVKGWLRKKDTYTKFRPRQKNFKRNPIIAAHIDAQWQGDLAEVGNLRKHNDGVRYLLVLIDVVSKYVWVKALKNKEGPTVLRAFKEIMDVEGGRRPLKMQTDDGKEFLFGGLQEYLKRKGIVFFTVKSENKAAIAERVIKTLKERLYRYMHEKHRYRYIDVLDAVVASYNDTYHSSIKMSPSEVNESNEGEVLNNLYGKYMKEGAYENRKVKFKVGDFVRLSVMKKTFEKGYVGNWSEEICVVDRVKASAVPNVMYKVKQWSGKEILGSFYDKELQLVDKDLAGFWKIEKVLKTRKVRGKKQYFVKWEGYPDSENSWIEDIKDIKKGMGDLV